MSRLTLLQIVIALLIKGCVSITRAKKKEWFTRHTGTSVTTLIRFARNDQPEKPINSPKVDVCANNLIHWLGVENEIYSKDILIRIYTHILEKFAVILFFAT